MKLTCDCPFCSGIIYEVDDYMPCPECGSMMMKIPDEEFYNVYNRTGDL